MSAVLPTSFGGVSLVTRRRWLLLWIIKVLWSPGSLTRSCVLRRLRQLEPFGHRGLRHPGSPRRRRAHWQTHRCLQAESCFWRPTPGKRNQFVWGSILWLSWTVLGNVDISDTTTNTVEVFTWQSPWTDCSLQFIVKCQLILCHRCHVHKVNSAFT